MNRKQKHQAMLEKRAADLEKERLIGLAAQEADRKRRHIEAKAEWQDTHDKRHYKFVKECPICTDILKEQKEKDAAAKRAEAIQKLVKASVSA